MQTMDNTGAYGPWGNPFRKRLGGMRGLRGLGTLGDSTDDLTMEGLDELTTDSSGNLVIDSSSPSQYDSVTAASGTGSTSSFGSTLTSLFSSPAAVAGVNSELFFGTNLIRGLEGKAPLTASQYAPQATVGLSSSTLLVVAGLGIAAIMLLGGHKS